jgi:hypothetical protein
MNIGHYAKAITYIALATAAVLVTALTDNQVTIEELINILIALAGAVIVYLVPNLEDGPGQYLKTIMTFGIAAGIAIASFLSGGVTLSEWVQVAIAAFAGIGVYVVPNEPPVAFAELGEVEYLTGPAAE